MKRIVFLALFITFSCFVKAQSDSFRSGVILGYSPNESILETSPLNAGLMAEFILPIVGVGAEVDFVYENKAFQTQTGSLSERFSNFKLPIYAKPAVLQKSCRGRWIASGKQVKYAVPIEHNSQLIVFLVKIIIVFV